MIILYDIPSLHPNKLWSPNVWKTRLALNYKGLPYRTEWVEYPEIEPLAEQFGVGPTTTKADKTTPEYTLPMIQDLSTGAVVADSFPIAIYLDKTYPDTPLLFPPGTKALQAAWNDLWNASFIPKADAVLLPNVKMGPGSEEYFKRTKAEKQGKARFEDIAPRGEERKRHFEAWKKDIGMIAACYRYNTGDGGHPATYAMGEHVSYADFIVAGWAGLARLVLDPEEWDVVKKWYDGLLERALAVTDKYRHSEDCQ